MMVNEAKTALINEISDEHSNNHYPYDCKYSKWKTIDFLWACRIENKDKGFIMDFLNNLYEKAGMKDEEKQDFIIKTELLIETINRKP